MQYITSDLHDTPRIYSVDNFLSHNECQHMISVSKTTGMTRAFVAGGKEGVISKGRTNDLCWIDHHTDLMTEQIASRVAALVGFPLSHAERFQLIKYSKGTEYRAHFDAFDPKTESGRRTMKNGGQRLITVLGYLNTVSKGGCTYFPKLKITVPATAGKLLVFHNCEAGTDTRHPHSLHAGQPVKEGEKWAFNLWFRTETRAGK